MEYPANSIIHSKTRRLLKIGLVANLFEWYEFSIFGYLAALIGQLFFETTSPIIGLIQAYQVFAISFIVRPLGGLFFALLGDRIGRGAALRLSLFLMSVSTILIGLLPTYSQVGVTAVILLLILRLIQGFSAGGELPTAACYILESSGSSNKSLLCTLMVAGPKMGMLLASLTTFLLFRSFDHVTLTSWAWRIPFLIGIPLTLLIVYIRSDIREPARDQQKTTPGVDWNSLIRPLAKATALTSFGSVYFYAVLVWMPSYLSFFLNTPSHVAYLTNTLILCCIIPLYGMVGYFSQRFGYQKLILLSTLLMLFLVVPLFKGLQVFSSWQALFTLQLMLVTIYVGLDGVLIETLGELFSSQNRSMGFGLAWTLSAALAGGTTPLLCSHVIHKTGWLMFPAFYIMALGFLILPIVLEINRTTYRNA